MIYIGCYWHILLYANKRKRCKISVNVEYVKSSVVTAVFYSLMIQFFHTLGTT